MAEPPNTGTNLDDQWHRTFHELADAWFVATTTVPPDRKRRRATELASALDPILLDVDRNTTFGVRSIENLLDGKPPRVAKVVVAVAFDRLFDSGPALADLWAEAERAKRDSVVPEVLPEVARSAGGAAVAEADTDDRRPGGRVALVALAVVALLLVAAIAVVARRPGDDRVAAPAGSVPGTAAVLGADVTRGTAPEPLRCTGDVGEVEEGIANAATHAAVRMALRAAFDTDMTRGACAVEKAHRLGPLVVQALGRPGGASDRIDPLGALVVVEADPGRRWWFNRALWGTFHQEWEQLNASAEKFIGPPTKIEVQPDGSVEVATEVGGIFVAEAIDAPYFWVTFLHTTWWKANRAEVGLPISRPNFFGGVQQFTRGTATLTKASLTEPVFAEVHDPAALLPRGPLAGHALHQPDGTSWWVPEEGRRQWIPDVETYDCLHADEHRLPDHDTDVAPQAIITLTFAGVATCPG